MYTIEMNTAGIIGGLGPETTADFYLKINQLAIKHGAAAKPSCVVSNVELPFSLEEALLKNGEGINGYLPFLKDSVSQLEKAGVDFIVIPCNTVHVLIEDLRAFATVPIISIVEATKLALSNANVKHAFLLATGVTIREGLYSDLGVEWTVPSASQQEVIDQIIFKLVDGSYTDSDKEELKRVISQDTVLLACSDLHIALQEIEGLAVFDTMDILAETTMQAIYKKNTDD